MKLSLTTVGFTLTVVKLDLTRVSMRLTTVRLDSTTVDFAPALVKSSLTGALSSRKGTSLSDDRPAQTAAAA